MSVIPWNKGRAVGQRTALSSEHIRAIVHYLKSDAQQHDLCLFMVGIDSMLRCSDLLRLKVADVRHADGSMRTTLAVRQKKTDQAVYPTLTPGTRNACRQWIEASAKRPGDYLFTRGKGPDAAPISAGVYRDLVKSWVTAIGLDEACYSSHSLRRSKAAFLYRQPDVTLEDIAKLLGHRNPQSTMLYLGLSIERAQQKALKHDIFAASPKPRRSKTATTASDVIDEGLLDMLADRVAENLLPKLVRKITELLGKNRRRRT